MLSSDKVEINVRNVVIFDFFSRCEILCGYAEIPVAVQNFCDAGGEKGGKCFFMGSSEAVLQKIRENAAVKYPSVIVETYSPPYKPVFSEEDNSLIIKAINSFNPDLLWIGMTAPKQEKWLHDNWPRLEIQCHAGAIGAVFDFFAGTLQRAPENWQKAGLEWLYRFIKEPRRMWRRNLISNPIFVWLVLLEKLGFRR